MNDIPVNTFPIWKSMIATRDTTVLMITAVCVLALVGYWYVLRNSRRAANWLATFYYLLIIGAIIAGLVSLMPR